MGPEGQGGTRDQARWSPHACRSIWPPINWTAPMAEQISDSQALGTLAGWLNPLVAVLHM